MRGVWNVRPTVGLYSSTFDIQSLFSLVELYLVKRKKKCVDQRSVRVPFTLSRNRTVDAHDPRHASSVSDR